VRSRSFWCCLCSRFRCEERPSGEEAAGPESASRLDRPPKAEGGGLAFVGFVAELWVVLGWREGRDMFEAL